ncbi:MAG: UDP-N-acetylmuramoyl-L-alanyl-D-glutamate--2,6-diaminopimelate ligase [Candidatus Omnitrophica bacterium]|nr:UDP-N-acetylmuramoyl-L-alanyl-D-glutamate--2,6-diaminopimelate ligase [Candidatus Omnitrophota bacterium]
MITIKKLFKNIKHKTLNLSPEFVISGIAVDSRAVKKGDLFIAVKGYEADGHTFIRDAVRRGAACVCATRLIDGLSGGKTILVKDTSLILPELAARFYGKPSRRLKFAGVTGTNGKTTTTHLAYEIFKASGRSPALLGSIKHRIRQSVIGSSHTTPGPVKLHSLLKDMSGRGCKYVIMEVSSHALKQSRVSGISYNVAALTNITGDHLDYHLTMSDYIDSKKHLFRSLKSDSAAILNRDDKYYDRFKKSTKAKVLSYGIRNKADFTARHIEADINGTRFFLDMPGGTINIRTPLIGRHNVYNVLAAAAISYAEGIKADVIQEAVGRLFCVPGRLESVDMGQRFKIFIDYAHTHDALKNILTELRNLSGGELVVVFGCGGNRDRTKRAKMGRIASEIADHVILTNDNPRKEDPGRILKEIEAGLGRGFKSYEKIPDRSKAIEKSLKNRNASDIVVIAGKGHEDYQIIGDNRFPFNDKEAVRKAFKEDV